MGEGYNPVEFAARFYGSKMKQNLKQPLYLATSPAKNLGEVALLSLRLGFTAFGGPVAHIAMLQDEVVRRRKWVEDQQFLDLVGATNLIPGPNSTEMVIHTGYLRAGIPGLLVAGTCFILPAMMMVTLLAWSYTRYGSTPQADWLLYGVKPVVIAIILQALIGLGRKAVKSLMYAVIGLLVVGAYYLGINILLLLAVGGLIMMLIENLTSLRSLLRSVLILPPLGLALLQQSNTAFDLRTLFLTFLKIGSVLYGSGYVLLAFLRADFVTRLGWLTDQQLIDAVAIGQITPGPVFTTATFIGFTLAGIPGAILATLGIFLPSFIFVAISNPIIPRLRSSPWAASFLDGVNVASLGLMAAVTLQLAQAALVDFVTILIALIGFLLVFRFRVNSTWIILGGALVGILSYLLR